MNFLIKSIIVLFICSPIMPTASSIATTSSEPITSTIIHQNIPKDSLVLNINAASNNPSSNVLTAAQNNNQETNHTHTHVTKIEWPSLNWPHFQMPSFQNELQQSYNHFWNYRWHHIAGLVGLSYVCLNVKIYNINKLLENPKSWCLWKEEIPLNRLTTIDGTELLKQLKIDICKKYFNTIETINDSELLIKFLEDISTEKKLLESYQSICSFSHSFYLSKLLIKTKSAEQITQYIARLNFLMDLYLERYIQTNNKFNNA